MSERYVITVTVELSTGELGKAASAQVVGSIDDLLMVAHETAVGTLAQSMAQRLLRTEHMANAENDGGCDGC